MSEDSTTPTAPTITAGQSVAIITTHPSDYAGLHAVVVYPPAERSPRPVVRIESPLHLLHHHTVDIAPEHLITSGKLLDPRYVHGISEIDDDMTDDEWASAYGPSDVLLKRWNAQSVTGGVSEGAQHNATVDGSRVIAVYVEDDQSDEFARMFECFFPDGSVDYVAEDEIELDDVDLSDEVSDDYRNDPAACIADEVHLRSTDDDGYCNACGHQQSDDDNESEG